MNELPARPLARIIRAEDAASWIDGYAFIEKAKAEAAAIRATAEDEVAKAREQGRAEGRRRGETEAAALLVRTQGEVDRYLASIEPSVAVLAMEIVQRVIGSIDDAELVARAAGEALEAMREENAVAINVAPALVDDVRTKLAALGSKAAGVRVTADRHLTGTQCTVTTLSTSIDIGIDAQLDAIRDAMAGMHRADP